MPASQRGSQAWFAQQAASPAPLLAVRHTAGSTAEQQAGAAERTWAKADRYYFASLARLQRLWQVSRCFCWWCDGLGVALGAVDWVCPQFRSVRLSR